MKNLVILIGRIASQPETRHAGDTQITSFTLVTDRPKLVDGKTVKNEAGYTETLAEFHRVTAFNGLGTSIAKHKKKGDMVEVQGRLPTGGEANPWLIVAPPISHKDRNSP